MLHAGQLGARQPWEGRIRSPATAQTGRTGSTCPVSVCLPSPRSTYLALGAPAQPREPLPNPGSTYLVPGALAQPWEHLPSLGSTCPAPGAPAQPQEQEQPSGLSPLPPPLHTSPAPSPDGSGRAPWGSLPVGCWEQLSSQSPRGMPGVTQG